MTRTPSAAPLRPAALNLQLQLDAGAAQGGGGGLPVESPVTRMCGDLGGFAMVSPAPTAEQLAAVAGMGGSANAAAGQQQRRRSLNQRVGGPAVSASWPASGDSDDVDEGKWLGKADTAPAWIEGQVTALDTEQSNPASAPSSPAFVLRRSGGMKRSALQVRTRRAD